MKKKVTTKTIDFVIQCVLWNQARYLPAFLGSLRRQTFKNFHLVLLDNNSTDTTRAILDSIDLRDIGEGVSVMRNYRNRGFGHAHDQILSTFTRSKWVGIVNADIVFPPHFLEEMNESLQQHLEYWLHTPRLMQAQWVEGSAEIDVPLYDMHPELLACETGTIDAVGLQLFSSGVIEERGRGLSWENYKDYYPPGPVFGASGAALFFEREKLPLLTVTPEGSLFNQLFFAYKEDCELAWRVQERGGGVWCHSQISLWHFRALRAQRGLRRIFDFFSFRGERGVLSYQHHICMLMLHWRLWVFLPATLMMILREATRIFFYVITGRFFIVSSWIWLLRTLPEIFSMRKKMRAGTMPREHFMRWIKSQ